MVNFFAFIQIAFGFHGWRLGVRFCVLYMFLFQFWRIYAIFIIRPHDPPNIFRLPLNAFFNVIKICICQNWNGTYATLASLILGYEIQTDFVQTWRKWQHHFQYCTGTECICKQRYLFCRSRNSSHDAREGLKSMLNDLQVNKRWTVIFMF